MQEKYCFGCMEMIPEDAKVCPFCGYNEAVSQGEAFHLIPGTVLKERYILGKCLGNGGFGVTYLGKDLILGNKVAIKEYLPSEFSTRTPFQQTVSIYTGEAERQFEAGLKRFDEEAKRLAKLSNIPGVVKIYDVFHENKTSYIVMEYLEGETVSDKIKRCGKFSYKEAEEIMISVLSTLEEVHNIGIIHRDVSPGNIFITKDENIKLIDFGAARFASAYHTKSLSVILKPGYAPEEQYRSKGNQGPWTDVYSAAATFYKMLTGKTPQESVDRMIKDDLVPLTKLGVSIEKNKENAIMNALNVDAEERTRSAQQFLSELCGKEKIAYKKTIVKKSDEGKIASWVKILAAMVPVMVIAAVFMFMNHGTANVNDEYVTVPNIINRNEKEAETILSEKGLEMVVSGTIEVEFGESDLVQKIVPATGSYLKKGETVEVFLSKSSTVIMPNVLYWELEDAKLKMEEAGLNTKIEYIETNDFADNAVISQQYEEGTSLSKNSLIKVEVAKRTEEQNPSEEIPGIAGMDIDEAAKILMESGYGLFVKEEKFDDSPVGTILEQKNPEDGTAVVEVTVSRGEKYFYMKDFSLSTKAEIEEYFKDSGININYEYIGTFEYAQDMVLEQKPSAGEKLFEGDKIEISLSIRSDMDFKTGKTITFGTYEQDNNFKNGAEPIEWQILEVQDGKVLVISKCILDAKKSDGRYGLSILPWLNGTFYNNAFTSDEKNSIVIVGKKYDYNNFDRISGKGTVKEKVRVLTDEEFKRYYKSSIATKYLSSTYTFSKYKQTPYFLIGGVARGNQLGLALKIGDYIGIRPVMWIDVYYFSEPEPVSSGVKVGDIVTFGSYQQKTNPNAGKDPIEWQVLDVKDGKALVLSKYILERKEVHNGSSNNVTYWETSDFRKWLNKDFINEAFTAEEKDSIIKSTIKNPANPKSGKGGGKDTTDKVFLLSYEEAEKYLPKYDQRKAEYTQKTNGEQHWGGLNDYWCLRTKSDQSMMVVSNEDGTITDSFGGGRFYWGIRPAMWVDESALTVENKIKVGNIISFGSYEQDNNFENGKEPIKWKVLKMESGRAMLITNSIIDAVKVEDNKGVPFGFSNKTETWLNGKFLNESFTSEEAKHILKIKTDYSYGKRSGTVNTKIRFLTTTEFVELEKETAGLGSKSEYVKRNYVFSDVYTNTPWCLIGGVVGGSGKEREIQQSTFGDYFGIRPVIWVDVSALTVENKIKAGNIISFGSYEQDNNLKNGAEPIEWQVLDVQDGKALVISKYGLDCKPYNDVKANVTWETCSLRKWLNGDFINEAFGAKEQQKIAVTKLSNPDNAQYGTNGGKETEDKVFILNIDEAKKYFSSDEERKCKPSDYAKKQEVIVDDNGNCWWWLRSPGNDQDGATNVVYNGIANMYGFTVYRDRGAVRPAMWIDLEKGKDYISIVS